MQDVRQALDVAIKSTLSPEESLDASSSMFQLYQSLTAFNTAYVCQETQWVLIHISHHDKNFIVLAVMIIYFSLHEWTCSTWILGVDII